jgi:hypothetical protein
MSNEIRGPSRAGLPIRQNGRLPRAPRKANPALGPSSECIPKYKSKCKGEKP